MPFVTQITAPRLIEAGTEVMVSVHELVDGQIANAWDWGVLTAFAPDWNSGRAFGHRVTLDNERTYFWSVARNGQQTNPGEATRVMFLNEIKEC